MFCLLAVKLITVAPTFRCVFSFTEQFNCISFINLKALSQLAVKCEFNFINNESKFNEPLNIKNCIVFNKVSK